MARSSIFYHALLHFAIWLSLSSSSAVGHDSWFRLESVLNEHEVIYSLEPDDSSLESEFIRKIDPGARIIRRSDAIQISGSAAAAESCTEWPAGIQFVRCSSLNSGAYSSLTNGLASFTNRHPKGLVLDLRGSTGWNVAELSLVASLFLPFKTPVCRLYTGRGTLTGSVVAGDSAVQMHARPVMVLVDRRTEGTSEILAGALSGRAGFLVLGEPTAGMACLREFIPLGEGRYIFIATQWADFGQGVKSSVSPDIQLNLNSGEYLPVPSWDGKHPGDLLELLRHTAGEESWRRASDLILARARLRRGTGYDDKSFKGR